jgi:hypothetical protein
MSSTISNTSIVGTEKAVNCAQAAGTYDLFTATGDCLVEVNTYYQITAGATFTSLAIQTDDTTPFVIMSAAEGAVANLTAQKNITTANKIAPFLLQNGKKIRMTLVGTTGTGTGMLAVQYTPVTTGAYLA